MSLLKIMKYYEKLYDSQKPTKETVSFLEKLKLPKLTDEDNKTMDNQITLNELRMARTT